MGFGLGNFWWSTIRRVLSLTVYCWEFKDPNIDVVSANLERSIVSDTVIAYLVHRWSFLHLSLCYVGRISAQICLHLWPVDWLSAQICLHLWPVDWLSAQICLHLWPVDWLSAQICLHLWPVDWLSAKIYMYLLL